MRLKILIVLVFLLFLLGCVQEGIKVVRVANNTSPTIPATTNYPSTNQTASNVTVNAQINVSNSSSAKGAPTNADLAVSTFYLSTMYPLPNEDFDVILRIMNQGTESIKDFEYSILIKKGEDIKKSERYSYNLSLDAGATTGKIMKTFSLDEGDYKIIITLDPANVFQEKNENNNIKEQSINVQYSTTSNSSAVRNDTRTTSSRNTTNTTSSGCTDTDGGLTYDLKGECTDSYGSNLPDICIDVNELWEWYCESGRCKNSIHTCYCIEGKCVS